MCSATKTYVFLVNYEGDKFLVIVFARRGDFGEKIRKKKPLIASSLKKSRL